MQSEKSQVWLGTTSDWSTVILPVVSASASVVSKSTVATLCCVVCTSGKRYNFQPWKEKKQACWFIILLQKETRTSPGICRLSVVALYVDMGFDVEATLSGFPVNSNLNVDKYLYQQTTPGVAQETCLQTT